MIEEPHGRFEFEGTVMLPIREDAIREDAIREDAIRELPGRIAYEVPPSAIPWGWIVATGSLILSFIICVTRK